MKTKIKKHKKLCIDSAKNICEGRELVLNAFKSGLFPLKLTQVTAGNNSENLVNEIRQIV